mgnify:CR=1 FL=1
MKEELSESARIYYSIGDVAKMFNVNASLIRFWEKEFDILRPQKNKKGNRLFTQKDVDNLHTIYHLVKERGYTLKGAKEKLGKDAASVEKDVEIIKTLDNIHDFLTKLKAKL